MKNKKMNHRLAVTVLSLFCMHTAAHAQSTIKEAFANAPDSIFPLLTRDNRLDCIDFAEGNVKMDVANRLDGRSRISQLTTDYLRLEMSPKSRIELRLLPATGQQPQRICMIHTYMGPAEDSQVSVYSTSWELLGHVHRPRAEAFTDGRLSHETMGMLADFSFMWAAFTDDGEGLVWTLPTTELNKAQQQEAEGHIHTITTPITLKPYSK